MKSDKIDQQIEEARQRLTHLLENMDHIPGNTQAILSKAMEELSIGLEELQVAGEELHEQNEALMIAHATLDREHQRYQSLFEFAPDGYLVTDRYGIILEANQSAGDQLNIATETLIGKPLATYVTQSDHPALFNQIQTVQEPGHTVELEVTLIPRHPKAEFQASLRMMPFKDLGGVREALRWQIRDVTEYKRVQGELRVANLTLEERVTKRTEDLAWANKKLAEELIERKQLQAENQRQSALLDAIFAADPGGLAVVTGSDLIVVYANPAYRFIAPISGQDIIGKPYQTVWASDEAASFLDQIRIVLESGRPFQETDYIRHYPDGAERHFNFQARRIGWENQSAALIVLWDTTALRLSEQALRASEEKFRTVADHTYDWEYWVSEANQLLYISPSCERTSGHTPQEFYANRDLFLEITHPEDREFFEHHVKTAHHSAETNTLHFRIVRPDGEVLWIEHICQPVYSSTGRNIGRRISNRDITVRKLADEAIHRQTQVMQAVNQILEGAIHGQNDEQIGQTCLKIVEEITGSRFGFIGEIGADGLLHDLAISDTGWEACTTPTLADPRRVRANLTIHGIYGQVILDGKSLIVNDPQNHPDRIGTPPGHPELTAFLGVPLICEGSITGMIAVGNRPGGYSDKEREILEYLAPVVLEAINRSRSETALQKNQQLLDALMEYVPEGITIAEGDDVTIRMVSRFGQELLGGAHTDMSAEDVADQWKIYDSDGCTPLPSEELPLVKAIRSGEVINNQDLIQMNTDGQPLFLSCNAGPIRDSQGKITGGIVAWRDVSDRKRAEITLQESQRSLRQTVDRLAVLSNIGAELLAGADPIDRLDHFFEQFSKGLGLDVYVQYNVAPAGDHLDLGSWAGFPEKYLKLLKRLEFGQAVCGTVAQIRQPIYVNNVQTSDDRKTKLIRSFDINTYACHPLIAHGRLLGTLSFGSRSQDHFEPETINILRTFCAMVAAAMARKNDEAALRQSEEEARFKSAELETIMDIAPAFVWVSRDPQCHFMISNRYGYDFLKIPQGANVSITPPDGEPHVQYRPSRNGQVLTPDQLPMQMAALTGIPQMNSQFDVVLPDGNLVNLYGNAAPLFDRDERPTGAVGVFIDVTELKHAEADTHQLTAENEIRHRLIEQREQERLQIARDLHDGPMQELAGDMYAIQHLINRCTEAWQCEELEAIYKSLRTQVEELRAYAGELRPPTLSKFGLEKAIRAHVDGYQEKHPEIKVHFEASQDTGLLEENYRLALFRVYQQAIHNITKHAKATEITIKFKKTGHQATLEIRDNGVGFDLPRDWIDLARSGHLGLVGMRERIEGIGGTLKIATKPGQGTTVFISVPTNKSNG